MLPLEPPIDIDRDTARAEALEELGKGKYSGPFPSWLSDAWRRFVDFLEEVLDKLSETPRLNGSDVGVPWGIILLAIVALGALSFLVWRFGLPRWSRRVADEGVGTDAAVEPDDYRHQAAALMDAGQIRDAVRDRFRAIVRELEIRTIIERRPARTAVETAVLAARELPDVTTELQLAARLFNDVMYSDHVPSPVDYEAMVAADARILAAAERGPVSLVGAGS